MRTYVALLRGVNVGGNRMVAMADLRALLETIGFADVRTVLQSGNVVFRGAPLPGRTLEKRLEKELNRRVGLEVDVHVRSADEWRAVIAANPFRSAAETDPGHLHVTVFRAPLDPAAVKALRAAIEGPEILQADGRHLYMVFPDGMGSSKAAALVERKLGARGTARNWNTVLKLGALCPSGKTGG